MIDVSMQLQFKEDNIKNIYKIIKNRNPRLRINGNYTRSKSPIYRNYKKLRPSMFRNIKYFSEISASYVV
jgi:hypothetical protein